MRALLLGGTGFFGGSILERLHKDGAIDHVQIASRSEARAAKVTTAAAVPAGAVALDITDARALNEAVERADIVLNAAGNAPETAPAAIEAAIRAKKPYVDLSMEVTVLLKAEALIEEFGDPGVPIVLGAGIHPGYTEMLGAHAAAALDSVGSVNLHMLAVLEDYGRPEVFIPMFQQGWPGIDGLQTMAKVVALTAYRMKANQREAVSYESNAQTFRTLDGYEMHGFVMPSIEALSLYRVLNEGVDTQMLMSFWPPAANDISRKAAPKLQCGDEAFPVVLEAMWRTVEAEERPKPAVHFWAAARGKKDGKDTIATAFTEQDWGNQLGSIATTARMFALTVETVARGHVSEIGLVAPVELFSTAEVFSVLAGDDAANVEVQLEEA